VKLGVKLALAMTALVAAVVVTAIWSIDFYLRRDVERQLRADIERTGQVLEEAQHTLLRSMLEQNRVVADEPRMRILADTTQVDAETVADAIKDLLPVVNADYVIVTDPAGVIRANRGVEGKPIQIPKSYMDALAAEGSRREFSAAWVIDGQVYLVAVTAVLFGQTPGLDRNDAAVRVSGRVITLSRINDKVLASIRRSTNTDLALFTQGRITAASLDPHLLQHRDELARVASDALGQGAERATVSAQQYLLRKAKVEKLEAAGGQRVDSAHFVLLRSLDEALRSYHQIRDFLFKFGFFAFAVALLAALVLSSTLSRRVAKLASATTLVAGGDLETNIPVGGSDEIGALGRAFNDMIAKLRISRDELRSKERLEKELEIATVIQTLLLPAQPTLDGFDVAARMVPAEEVGGDFYDVHQASAGSWVAIGDVSGHGVTPGLIMMMVQSMLSAISRQGPEIGQRYTPGEVLRVVNSALHDNLRTRMHDDNYMTMVLLKHVSGGRFKYAGAHESLLVYRRATHQVETLPTDGTWLGLQDDIGPFMEDHEIDLQPGDALVLYTDGVTEAKNPQGVQYNIDRLRDMLIRQGSMAMPTAAKIRDGIVDDVMSWSRTRQDDVTVLVLRRLEA
jgi:sigma-B regulation protein RsbU (phosphoserine phosphatase)